MRSVREGRAGQRGACSLAHVMKHPFLCCCFCREVHMRSHHSASIINAARWLHYCSHPDTGRIGEMRRRRLWRGHAFCYSSGKTNMGDEITLRARLARPPCAKPFCVFLSRPEREKKSCNALPHSFLSFRFKAMKANEYFRIRSQRTHTRGFHTRSSASTSSTLPPPAPPTNRCAKTFSFRIPSTMIWLHVWATSAAITVTSSNAMKKCVLIGPSTHMASLLVKEHALLFARRSKSIRPATTG